MKRLFPLLTSLGICVTTALPSSAVSVSDSSLPTDTYYTTRDLITSSLTNTQIQDFKQQIHKEACSFGQTRTVLENGVTLRYRFWTPDGQLLKTWLLASSAVNCNSMANLPIQVINHAQEYPKDAPVAQPKQPVQPIGNLQLGMIVMMLGVIVAAIAKSCQSISVASRKTIVTNSIVNRASNPISPLSEQTKNVEMFNYCSSNPVKRKMGELSVDKRSYSIPTLKVAPPDSTETNISISPN
ncbi:MAG: hypothetical protein AB4058_14290 [Microcystaceae cyanobacterium]